MTRINAGIPVSELCDKHLLAEHREIKRIPNAIKTGKAKLDNIPAKFTLGTGHVKFFYNKLGYLLSRYIDIYNECRKRGFQVEDYRGAWNDQDPDLMGWWIPSEEDKNIIRARIKERLDDMAIKKV